MIFTSLLSMLIHQSWQVALLASSVWLVTRIAGGDRAHLAHMLWTLVLIKCITPPIWSSPVGLFSRMNIQFEIADASHPNRNAMKFNRMDTRREFEEAVVASRSKPDAIDSLSGLDKREVTPVANLRGGTLAAIAIIWISVTALFALVSSLRFLVFLKVIRRTVCDTPPEVARCVRRLNVQLGLRRSVGVKVVNTFIGPAVYGLFKPTILLPQAIIAGRTEQQWEPLIAHEMIHIRRGDLWLALVQSIACCVGWFHPMVWLASRRVTIESERCCDEETIASLQCKPAVYARSLFDVLELKHLLRVAPALPGVRPVDITLSRLERIMRLGQGSRSRSPWWVWCTAIVCGIAVLPGAQLVTAQSQEQTKVSTIESVPERTVEPLATPNFPLTTAAPAPLVARVADSDADMIVLSVQILEIPAGSEESKEWLAWLVMQPHQLIQREIPILSKIPYLNRLFMTTSHKRLLERSKGSKQIRLVVLSEDQASRFSEMICRQKEYCVSSPMLSTISGTSVCVKVRQTDDPNNKMDSVGFSLTMKPMVVDEDQIQLDYEMTKTTRVEAADGDETASKDQSAIDLLPTYLTSTVQTSVGLSFDQTFVVGSRQAHTRATYEIVMVKCTKSMAFGKSLASPE